jgi:superfamily II DNA/RNA helicase
LAFFKKRDVVIQAQTGSGKTLAYLMPTIDNLDFVARKMLQVLIIVPSRELTIQTVMLAYRLFGGNVNVGVPGASDNMFNYKGPQGIKVVGVFEEDHETREGFADVAEIVVGTPDALARMKNAGFLEVDLAQTIIADEADQLFEQFPEAMETLLAPSPYAPVMEDRQVVLCGVSVPDSVVQLVQQRGHFKQNPLSIQMGTPGRVPPSVKHRRLVTPRARKLVALARQIRADLAFAGEDAPPPRTIVFVPSAVAAEAAAGPLRKSLWGKHKLAVLLPDGKEAVRVMQDFKNQKTTLLLCTPDVERGLDMPGVDYIYSLDAPSLSASYLHRAGRCGRLGATTTGVVTSVVTPEEASALDQTMVDLEIPSWETLEEQVNEPSVGKERGADSAESANDETDDSERYSSSSPIEEEERALTAAALNDLFYLVDAQADAVNALEAVFASGDAAASWDEDEEDDPEDLASQRRLDEIRKLFEIVDERDLDDEDGKGK